MDKKNYSDLNGALNLPEGSSGRWQITDSKYSQDTDGEVSMSDHPTHTVKKALFAQGSQLVAGTTTIPETEGLGISLPYSNINGTFKTFTSEGAVDKQHVIANLLSYKLYDYTNNVMLNTTDGNGDLRNAGIITLPAVGKDMYIFVKSSAEPTSVTGASTPDDDPFSVKENVYLYQNNSGNTQDVVLYFAASTTVEIIAVTNKVKAIGSTGYATESRDTIIDHTYQDKLTIHPVKAYYIDTYNGSAYNYNSYPEVKKLGPVSVVPIRTGAVLHEDKDVVVHESFISPLFVPAVNVTETTDDATNRGKNWMAPSVKWDAEKEEDRVASKGVLFYSEQAWKNTAMTGAQGGQQGDKWCTKFILTNTYYRYTKATGDDPTEYLINSAAFYHLKTTGRSTEENTLAGNKAFLLIENLPTALWKSSGAREGMIYIDLEEWDDEATPIDEAVVDHSQQKDVYYTLSGTRISGRPTAKGIYISNGKKITLK